jgi:branched-chain amino acid transport system substrate-binding protein
MGPLPRAELEKDKKMLFSLPRGAVALAVAAAALSLTTTASFAQKNYDPGVTDTEIKVGNIMPYSGPASAYGIIGKTEAAYFKMINDKGGINGRKINFISYDDAYSPPKTVEQTRKLVEGDEVLLVFNPLGTAGNTAIQKYMNNKKVPQLFVSTGAAKFDDPQHFPWTMGWGPNYQSEARTYAKYILETYPGKDDRHPLSERRLRQRLPDRHPSDPR